jgi:hypothetical protein
MLGVVYGSGLRGFALTLASCVSASLVVMSTHCAPTECDQYSDCAQGYTCAAGQCVLPPGPPDSAADAAADAKPVHDAAKSDAAWSDAAPDAVSDAGDAHSTDAQDALVSDAPHDGTSDAPRDAASDTTTDTASRDAAGVSDSGSREAAED